MCGGQRRVGFCEQRPMICPKNILVWRALARCSCKGRCTHGAQAIGGEIGPRQTAFRCGRGGFEGSSISGGRLLRLVCWFDEAAGARLVGTNSRGGARPEGVEFCEGRWRFGFLRAASNDLSGELLVWRRALARCGCKHRGTQLALNRNLSEAEESTREQVD